MNIQFSDLTTGITQYISFNGWAGVGCQHYDGISGTWVDLQQNSSIECISSFLKTNKIIPTPGLTNSEIEQISQVLVHIAEMILIWVFLNLCLKLFETI